jgi:ABC-type bacteriocin/lantibiotic exporter with double-glycine peptidase domain
MRKSIRNTLVALAIVAGGVTWVANSYPPTVPVAKALVWGLGGNYLGRAGVTLQQGKSDCGVAALAMLLGAHGRPAKLAEETRSVLGRDRGLTLLEMRDIAERHGLEASGWKVDTARLNDLPLPAVAHFADHYVVVDQIAEDGTVRVRDPALGRASYPRDRFTEMWTGNVLVIGPAAELHAP